MYQADPNQRQQLYLNRAVDQIIQEQIELIQEDKQIQEKQGERDEIEEVESHSQNELTEQNQVHTDEEEVSGDGNRHSSDEESHSGQTLTLNSSSQNVLLFQQHSVSSDTHEFREQISGQAHILPFNNGYNQPFMQFGQINPHQIPEQINPQFPAPNLPGNQPNQPDLQFRVEDKKHNCQCHARCQKTLKCSCYQNKEPCGRGCGCQKCPKWVSDRRRERGN